jgi:hypothetical protein
VKTASRDRRPPPPLSLETVWDKGKWHFDADDFPPQLPLSAGYAHILAALRFLDERGQLTKEGREELAGALGDDIALLSAHIKTGARAFLDQCYQSYLSECEYGGDSPVAVLEREWAAYVARYDPSRRPRANPYQKILLDHGPQVDNVLRRAAENAELRERLRAATSFAPDGDRALLHAALQAMDRDLPALARDFPDGEMLLHALRYIGNRAADRLASACLLARRLGIDENDTARLPLVAWGVNLSDRSRRLEAWSALGRDDQMLLIRLVNAFFERGDDQHLALCAMRTVGDHRSVELMEAAVPGKGEGTASVNGGPFRPAWDEVRAEVRASVRRRFSALRH